MRIMEDGLPTVDVLHDPLGRHRVRELMASWSNSFIEADLKSPHFMTNSYIVSAEAH